MVVVSLSERERDGRELSTMDRERHIRQEFMGVECVECARLWM